MTMPALRPALLVLALAAGCAGPAVRPGTYEAFAASAPGRDWVRTELFFGMSRATAPLITAKEWQEFMDGTVTPLFPDGLTVLDGRGQWRSPGGTFFNEPCKVLVILHPPDPAFDEKLERLRSTWKDRFGQESVLRATSPVKAGF